MASFAYDDEEDLALRGLRLEPEERHHDTCDAIWHWLQSQPGHVARYFRWRTAPQAAIHEFCRTIKLVSVRRSTLLCRQGEVGTSFYIVLHGSCEVLHHPVRMVSAVHARIGVVGNVGAIVVSSADRSRLGCRVGVMTAGMVFGEMSACGNERDSSVVALGSHSDEDGATHLTELLQIDFRAYSRCTPSTLVKAEAILRRRVEQLMHLTLFADWPTQELGFFARWITEITLKERDEIVYAEGEPVDCVYFVLKGSVGLQCQHPTDRDGLLNLHHLPAPRFFGEDELMQGIEERVHTAVTVEPNTVLGMLPARVFRVLLTSQYPASSYKSAATLAAIRRSRTDWYDIRMSLGDSAAVPFSFLDHSQNKVLVPEVYQGIITRERHIDNLFTPVLSGEDGALSTARKQALGLSTPGSSKGEEGSIKKRQRPRSAIRRKVSLASPMFGDHEGAGHAEAAAAVAAGEMQPAQGRSSPMPLTSRSVVPPLNLGGGSPAKTPTPVRAGQKPATPTAFEKFYSGTYHRPSTPEAPPTPPPEPALDPAELLGTPRFELERPSSPMDWNARPVTEEDFEKQKTRGTIAVELGSVMKAVSQFKKLLSRRRARQAKQRAAAAASEHGPSSHRSRGSDEGLGVLSGSLTPHVHGAMPHAMGGAGREGKRHRRPEGMRPLGELGRPSTSHTRGKSLARTGSMGAATLAQGPVRGASLRGKSLRGTKSLGAMVSSSKSSSRLLPSIRHPPAQQGSSPLAKSAIAGIDSPASVTSSHSSGSARSRRSIHRGSAKPQSLRNSLLKQRAASHMSPGEARPASPASPATLRASQASARRRNSRSGAAELGLGSSAGPSPGQSRAGSPGAQRSWSPARGGPARDLGESSPEADRRRHRLSLALGQEAQSQLTAAMPGSPAANLPAAARRASIASRRRRTSSQDSSADELKAVLG